MPVCARCGAQNQPTNKFCLSCGAPLQQQPAPHAAPPHAQPAQNPGPPPQAAPPQQGWGYQPPPQQAPPPQAPPPHQQGWGQPPQAPPGAGGFAPAAPGFGSADNLRVGTPDGLNPFGATFAPHQEQQAHPGYGPSPYGPPPAGLGGPPPHAQPQHAPPPHAQPHMPQHYAPPPQQAPVQPHAPQPAPWGQQNPAAFAETANPGPPQQQPPQPMGQPAAQVRGPSNPPGAPQAGPRDPEYIEPDAPRVLAGFLVSYENSPLGSFFPIYQGQNAVGRKGAAPGLSIEFDHATTSSRHALLLASARPGRIKLEDLGSTNGTFVGDAMLERGRRHELKDGDVVRFGGYVTIVKIV
jgi:hypothetical protein